MASKFPEKFAAGRGRALQAMKCMPLEAEKFARRKKMQELFIKGEVSLREEIPESLLRLQTPHSIKKSVKRKTSEDGKASNNSNMSKNMDDKASSREPALSSTVKPEIGNGIHHKGKDILNYQDTVKSDSVAVTRKTEGAISSNTRPLRRPEKATTKSMNAIKFEDKESVPISTKSKIRLTQKSKKESGDDEGAIGHKAWLEWEKKVVVKGSLDDDDLQEIAIVEDNDDISDVIVHQYIDALHKNQKKKGLKHNNKITPNQVQQLSKLKSTSNADCVRVAPGTLPNPPKGDDRWGGVELKSVSAPSGWGNLESDGLNRYNDGSACWSSQSNPYGGVSWSNCS